MSPPESCPWRSDAADASDRLTSRFLLLLVRWRVNLHGIPPQQARTNQQWTMADAEETSLAESPTPLSRHKLEPAITSIVPQEREWRRHKLTLADKSSSEPFAPSGSTIHRQVRTAKIKIVPA
ncbi:hypothetical protein RvY_04592 [Ramazzottius varieornatus]|uniref:Uncharacterized protein n=1 Tax=Ramazzottius varieornatus TaxID=947166 RepID=A0A1D1USS4_RAMVA|nr:hypothetical protein RvY_04592 [Ramazzottius varieornatus]